MTNKSVTIIDIRIKGTNTISHDIIPKPRLQRKFNNIAKISATQILINATVYIPFMVSITICVIEKTRYINAGGHICFSTIYIILRKKGFPIH